MLMRGNIQESTYDEIYPRTKQAEFNYHKLNRTTILLERKRLRKKYLKNLDKE
jgi:hypothetical protein